MGTILSVISAPGPKAGVFHRVWRSGDPADRLSRLYAGMVAHIAQGRLPSRDNRINPRVVKRKMSNFAKKRAEHYRPQHPQTAFEQAIRILK